MRGGAGPAGGPRRRPFVLKENQNVSMLQLTPDEKSVLFALNEPDPGEKGTVVPNYVSRSGFTETIPSHAKAGYPGGTSKAGLMDTALPDSELAAVKAALDSHLNDGIEYHALRTRQAGISRMISTLAGGMR